MSKPYRSLWRYFFARLLESERRAIFRRANSPLITRIIDDGSGTGARSLSPASTEEIVPENALLSTPLLSMKLMLNGSTSKRNNHSGTKGTNGRAVVL